MIFMSLDSYKPTASYHVYKNLYIRLRISTVGAFHNRHIACHICKVSCSCYKGLFDRIETTGHSLVSYKGSMLKAYYKCGIEQDTYGNDVIHPFCPSIFQFYLKTRVSESVQKYTSK